MGRARAQEDKSGDSGLGTGDKGQHTLVYVAGSRSV